MLAVFDTGLGSYALVAALHEAYPKQDILYFADRGHFPYGGKSLKELEKIIRESLDFLEERGATSFLLASNSPSITVLSKIQKERLFGIYPPLKEIVADGKKNCFILGAKVMTESLALKDYIQEECGSEAKHFVALNASPLVALVESGDFLKNPEKTRWEIQKAMAGWEEDYGKPDAISLSSTHLPWLASYFEEVYPEVSLYDPASRVIQDLAPYMEEGSGKILALISESPKYPAKDFLENLERLGISLDYEIV